MSLFAALAVIAIGVLVVAAAAVFAAQYSLNLLAEAERNLDE